jgi:hypothetical protein
MKDVIAMRSRETPREAVGLDVTRTFFDALCVVTRAKRLRPIKSKITLLIKSSRKKEKLGIVEFLKFKKTETNVRSLKF